MSTASNTLASLVHLATDPGLGALMLLLTVAGGVDLVRRRIPNWLVLAGLLFALALAALPASVAPQSLSLLSALAGMAVGFALTLPFYLVRGMAAGDVKLMAMAGSFLGPTAALYAVFWSFVAGGVLGLGYLVVTRRFNVLRQNVSDAVGVGTLQVIGGHAPQVGITRVRSAGLLPFGVAIAVGTILFVIARGAGFVGHG